MMTRGKRLLRIVRRSAGSVVTRRRAQMILLSAQGMDPARIAEVTFTSPDRVRDVIHNFNAEGFDSLYPKYRGGRPPTFTLPQRREMKKIAKSKPAEHGLPFSTWSLAKLADFLVAEGVVDDISIEGLREILRAEGVSFQRIKTWKHSRDPEYAVKKARIEHLYAIADGEVKPEEGGADRGVQPGRVRAAQPAAAPGPAVGRAWRQAQGPTPRAEAAPTGHLHPPARGPAPVAALDLGRNMMYGHVKKRKKRAQFLEFCRYLRSLDPPQVRIAIVCDIFSPHLTTRADTSVSDWAEANNVAYTPTNSSWLNRIEAQFTALRYFTLDGTDHQTHAEQNSMIRRYIAWRNRNTDNPRLRRIVERANAA